MPRQTSAARRGAGIVLRAIVPSLLTIGAGMLGYAIAIRPIRAQANKLHETETLGSVIRLAELRSKPFDAYYPDSGVEPGVFDDIAWVTPLVITPFVGVGPAPGNWYNAHIDSHQFRGQRELTSPKLPGVTRIFLTGASVAFSSGAPSDERTIGAYLQRLLDQRGAQTGRRYEVFTFATAAWSSTHERIAVENRISEMQPDLVISITGVGDLLFGEWGHNVLWARSRTDQYYPMLVNVALMRVGLEPMADVGDVAPKPVAPEAVAARLKKNFDLAAVALAMSHARLHVFLQPNIVTTRKPLSKSEAKISARITFAPFGGRRLDYYGGCRTRIGAAFRKDLLPANVSYSDLSEVFDSVPQDETVFLDSFHFGDRGNSIIAAAIDKMLAASGEFVSIAAAPSAERR
jgi:hypothetical protein